MEFFHWVTLYHGVLTNLIGEDRMEAMKVIDDDRRFDKWLQDFDRKNQQAASGGGDAKPKGGSMSKEQYMAQFGKVVG